MELCDQNLIKQLMAKSPRPRMRRATPPDESPPPQTKRRLARRCRCGQCTTCLDNARWELIFQEKFADPHYYAPRPVRHTSALDLAI